MILPRSAPVTARVDNDLVTDLKQPVRHKESRLRCSTQGRKPVESLTVQADSFDTDRVSGIVTVPVDGAVGWVTRMEGAAGA